MTLRQYQDNLICALIGLLGALMTAGDVGCYMAWRCTNILGNFGIWGIILMSTAMILFLMSWSYHRWAEKRT